MSENPQLIQPVMKFSTYKTPKSIWFRDHLLLPFLLLSGIITIYLSVMINRLALIGFVVIIALFFVRPGLEVYHMRHLSLWEHTILILGQFGHLVLVLGGTLLLFTVFMITESIIPVFLLFILFFVLIDRLDRRRSAKQVNFWNKSHTSRN